MISAAAKESIPRNYGELAKAIQDSYDKLRPFRETNREIVEEWVGNRYSDETKRMHKSLVNQLAQSIETFSIYMVPQRPAVNITTNFTEYKPTAASLKLAVNNELQNMNIETVLESIVTNAWMIHSVGNKSLHRLGRRSVVCTNYPPIRYYYRFRNLIAVWRETRVRWYLRREAHRKLKEILKVLLFERDKVDKLVFAFRGLVDGFRGQLGKLY